MNDTLKKWLLYLLAGLVPVWLLDTVLIPRLGLSAAPVLLPVCVVAVAVLERWHLLGGLITGLAPAGALLLVAMKEFLVTMVCAPAIYWLFYKLYHKSGGKPV